MKKLQQFGDRSPISTTRTQIKEQAKNACPYLGNLLIYDSTIPQFPQFDTQFQKESIFWLKKR